MQQLPVLRKGSRGPFVKVLTAKLAHITTVVFDGALESSVRNFQRLKGLDDDGIVGYNTWKALGFYQEKQMPVFLIWHTTATPDIDAWTARRVVEYHTIDLGWGRSGYSKIVERNGNIHNAWDIDLSDGFQPFEVTYGARELNPYSLHYSWMGGMDSNGASIDNRTDKQKESMDQITQDIVALHPDILIAGHNDFHATACPGFDLKSWLRDIGIEEKNIY